MQADTPIVMVAPFSPLGSGGIPSLGAARKIKSVLGALSTFGRELILVNSAHNALVGQRAHEERQLVRPGLNIRVVTPTTLSRRPLGKFFNLFEARSMARGLAEQGAALLWIYNGYAFEGLFALEFHQCTGCPLVLELEDLPFARKRPANLKPRIDNHYLHRVMPIADMITCVNQSIPALLGIDAERVHSLPGLVADELVYPSTGKPPFHGADYVAGYFGHLSEEKGAGMLLDLLPILPAEWKLMVTGTGPLSESFFAAVQRFPGRIDFFPDAPDDALAPRMLACDVIVNPHACIATMGDGVFPFKVVEALASGRLVISTTLPPCGIDLDGAVCFVDHSASAFREALLGAPEFHRFHRREIDQIAAVVRSRFSESALAGELERRFPALGSGVGG